MKTQAHTQNKAISSVSSILLWNQSLQRTCACGGTPGPTGECAECRRKKRLGVAGSSLQPKLHVNQPGDPYEQEADRVAEQVMRMSEPTLQRQVDEDEEEEEKLLQAKPLVQRQVTGGAGGNEAPPVVHEVLRSPGRPLDAATRQFMESRFGHNFGQVRVHYGPLAAASTQAVQAEAYTVGWDVVFAAGRYRPDTQEGKYLLAHELTHALQQQTGGKSWVARRGPLPRPPVRASVRVGTRPGIRYGVPPRSLADLAEVMRQRSDILAAEETIAVLSHGGSPPDFITEHEQLGMWEWGTARYTVRHFHILSAIEYDVMRATTQEDLIQVLRSFIPEALPEELRSTPVALHLDPRLFGVTFPENFDPGGEQRLRVFWEAFERRNRQLQTETEAAREEERRRTVRAEPQECIASGPTPDVDVDLAYGYCDEYGCEIEPIAQQFGRYPCHADFARSLSGVSREFRITTPDGLSADFDAMDWGGALYEVKTGYRWVPFTTNDQARQAVIRRFVEQSEHQMEVAKRCHRTLDWYFNDEQAADFFDGLVQPPVRYVPFDCNQDSDD